MLAGAVVVGVFFLRTGPVPGACAGAVPKEVQLRMLLVGDATDPAVHAWQTSLDLEGVPYRFVSPAAAPTVRLVGEGGVCEYAASIVADPPTLAASFDARLAAYAARFELRRIVAW